MEFTPIRCGSSPEFFDIVKGLKIDGSTGSKKIGIIEVGDGTYKPVIVEKKGFFSEVINKIPFFMSEADRVDTVGRFIIDFFEENKGWLEGDHASDLVRAGMNVSQIMSVLDGRLGINLKKTYSETVRIGELTRKNLYLPMKYQRGRIVIENEPAIHLQQLDLDKSKLDLVILCKNDEIITEHLELFKRIYYFGNPTRNVMSEFELSRLLEKENKLANIPNPKIVDLRDFDKQTVSLFVRYQSGKNLKNFLYPELFSLYRLADYVGDESLKEKCSQRLLKLKGDHCVMLRRGLICLIDLPVNFEELNFITDSFVCQLESLDFTEISRENIEILFNRALEMESKTLSVIKRFIDVKALDPGCLPDVIEQKAETASDYGLFLLVEEFDELEAYQNVSWISELSKGKEKVKEIANERVGFFTELFREKRWLNKIYREFFRKRIKNFDFSVVEKAYLTREKVSREHLNEIISAAERENVLAQYCLGWIHENGLGVNSDKVEAVKWYRKSAEQGHAEAQCNLGVKYDYGEGGLTKDKTEAVKWYRKSAEQGYAAAQHNLGVKYDYGEGGLTKDKTEAAKWYRKSAEQGCAAAQCNLGFKYDYGEGGLTKDKTEAAKWYRKSAEQGYAAAQCNLGFQYDYGEGGLTKDKTEAVKWYRKSAEQGYAEAQYRLGFKYDYGEGGLTEDKTEAAKWYRKSAEQGYAEAQYRLGFRYYYGEGGLTEDKTEAAKWLRKAVKQRHAEAQHGLGCMYYHGEGGLTEDKTKAVKWARKSAEQGSAGGQNHLGSMYYYGEGGLTEDKTEAAKWYRKSAEQGFAAPQCKLGIMYYHGEGGLTESRTEAAKWLRKSAKQGDARAQDLIKKFAISYMMGG